MALLRRALLLGVAFGLATGVVEAWLNVAPFVMRRFGPGPLSSLRVTLLHIGVALPIAVAAAPLLKLPRGTILHVLGLGLAWYGLQLWVALDSPTFESLRVASPVGATALVLIGLAVARTRQWLPWALAGVLLIAAMATPQVYLRVTTPPQPVRAALPPPRPGAPDVVLVVLDTVRAMSLSGYGYGRPTSPGLERLAAEGALFLDATSPSTWSLPSHASLFTGRYPSSHGAHAEHRFLDDRFPTLAQVLEGNGYETFCFTSNAWISDGLGLTRGFAHQDASLRGQAGAGQGFSFVYRLLDRLGLIESDKGGDLVTSSFEAWAGSRPADTERPAFVFLNFIEAHFPYHQLPHDYLFRFTDRPYQELREISIDLLGAQFGGAGLPFEVAGEPTRDMYDGGIVYTDFLLDRVVSALRSRGSLDDTILVVLADHGELIGERADFFGHGPSLYQPVVGVPLLVRYPPGVPAGARVEQPVSTLGVYGTILELADIEAPPTLQVGSLVSAIGGGAAGGPIFSELHDASAMRGETGWADPQMQPNRRYRLLREGNLKLVASSAGDRLLYDLAADPGETREISAERPEDLARMQARMQELELEIALPALDAPLAVGEEAPALDDETRERLRALGYTE